VPKGGTIKSYVLDIDPIKKLKEEFYLSGDKATLLKEIAKLSFSKSEEFNKALKKNIIKEIAIKGNEPTPDEAKKLVFENLPEGKCWTLTLITAKQGADIIILIFCDYIELYDQLKSLDLKNMDREITKTNLLEMFRRF
jgi:hypothetical protein